MTGTGRKNCKAVRHHPSASDLNHGKEVLGSADRRNRTRCVAGKGNPTADVGVVKYDSFNNTPGGVVDPEACAAATSRALASKTVCAAAGSRKRSASRNRKSSFWAVVARANDDDALAARIAICCACCHLWLPESVIVTKDPFFGALLGDDVWAAANTRHQSSRARSSR